MMLSVTKTNWHHLDKFFLPSRSTLRYIMKCIQLITLACLGLAVVSVDTGVGKKAIVLSLFKATYYLRHYWTVLVLTYKVYLVTEQWRALDSMIIVGKHSLWSNVVFEIQKKVFLTKILKAFYLTSQSTHTRNTFFFLAMFHYHFKLRSHTKNLT